METVGFTSNLVLLFEKAELWFTAILSLFVVNSGKLIKRLNFIDILFFTKIDFICHKIVNLIILIKNHILKNSFF
jgi:hypothetical protein